MFIYRYDSLVYAHGYEHVVFLLLCWNVSLFCVYLACVSVWCVSVSSYDLHNYFMFMGATSRICAANYQMLATGRTTECLDTYDFYTELASNRQHGIMTELETSSGKILAPVPTTKMLTTQLGRHNFYGVVASILAIPWNLFSYACT